MSTNQIIEKVGVLSAKADAAHSRIDKLELVLRDDLKEIKEELKDLMAHMNRSKGWAAAFVFFAGMAGAGFTKLLALLFKG